MSADTLPDYPDSPVGSRPLGSGITDVEVIVPARLLRRLDVDSPSTDTTRIVFAEVPTHARLADGLGATGLGVSSSATAALADAIVDLVSSHFGIADVAERFVHGRTETGHAWAVSLRWYPLGAGALVVLDDATDSELAHLGERFQAVGGLLLDADLRVVWSSPLLGEMLGIDPGALVGRPAHEFVHPDDLAIVQEGTALLLEESHVRYVRLCHPALRDLWWPMRLTVGALELPWGRALTVSLDVELGAISEGPAAQPSSALGSLVDSLPMGVVVAAGGRIVMRNLVASRLLGGNGPLEDGAWLAGVRADERDHLLALIQEAEAGLQPKPVVVGVRGRDREEVGWVQVQFAPYLDDHGQPVGWAAMVVDVSEERRVRDDLEQAQQALWHLANHDRLTGLPNRGYLADRFSDAVANAERLGHAVAVLFCDLDGFKRVNDEAGHHVGDRVLCEVGRRLTQAIRSGDVVARVGGDEFVVLASLVDRSELDRLADRLLLSLAAPIDACGDLGPGSGAVAPIGVSIGATIVGSVPPAFDTVLRLVDAAMYDAKRAGKGRMTFVDAETNQGRRSTDDV